MQSPFTNDPFAMVAKAFSNLYPGKQYEAYWEPEISDDEDGNETFGMTESVAGEIPYVLVTPQLRVSDAVEVFAHELAHVAVGVEHEHDDVWEAAFDAIFHEYNLIGDELFANVDAGNETGEDNL